MKSRGLPSRLLVRSQVQHRPPADLRHLAVPSRDSVVLVLQLTPLEDVRILSKALGDDLVALSRTLTSHVSKVPGAGLEPTRLNEQVYDTCAPANRAFPA